MAIAKEKKQITANDILSATNGGYDVFRKELGNFPVSKTFKHPLYVDSQPSAGIICKGGIWFLKDFSEEMPTMTAIQFIQKKYNISFTECVKKLSIQYGLKDGVDEKYQSVKIEWKAPVIEDSEITFNFDVAKWGKEHTLFWENTGVTKELCEKYDVYPVKEILMNKRRMHIRPNEIVWAYYAAKIDRVKFYFPEREKKNRFKGNVNGQYLWNIDNILKCRKLIIIKSMKDLLCACVIHPCTIAVQSESARIFTSEVVERINKISGTTFVSFGSDAQGVEQSTILTEKYGWGWINPDKSLLPEINDFYGLSHKYGVKELEKLLKTKNI